MPGSDIYLYQETLYRSESCKRKLRKKKVKEDDVAWDINFLRRWKTFCVNINSLDFFFRSKTAKLEELS